MIKCPFCQTPHVDNTLFCSECGTYLLEDDKRGTDPLGTSEIGWVGDSPDDSDSQDRFHSTGPLAIRLQIGERRREVEIPLNKAIHMLELLKELEYGAQTTSPAALQDDNQKAQIVRHGLDKLERERKTIPSYDVDAP